MGASDIRPVKEDTPVNRETKLALLIGFVSIVVVTVLVGEHFGKARNTAPATSELGTSTAAAPSTTGLTVDPITATPVSTPSAPAPVVQPMGIGSTGGTVQPVELTTTGTNVAKVTPAGGDRNVFIPPAAAGVDTIGGGTSTLGGGEMIPGTHPVNTLGGKAPGFEVPQAGLPVSSGVEKMHPVQKGETLASLAQKYYNDKSVTDMLATYNKGKLGSNGALRQGVTLRIPPKDVLMGKAVLAGGAHGRTDATTGSAPAPLTADKAKAKPTDKPVAEKATAEKAKATGARTYTVKKGDTLMTIAASQLGSAKRWEALLVANPHLDENSLRTGMTIKIPATK